MAQGLVSETLRRNQIWWRVLRPVVGRSRRCGSWAGQNDPDSAFDNKSRLTIVVMPDMIRSSWSGLGNWPRQREMTFLPAKCWAILFMF